MRNGECFEGYGTDLESRSGLNQLAQVNGHSGERVPRLDGRVDRARRALLQAERMVRMCMGDNDRIR